MAAETVPNKAGTQLLGTYIDRIQATVAEWVAFCPILELCGGDTGYEVGGRRQEPRWRQTADRNQLSATLKDISVTTRYRWQGSGGKGEALEIRQAWQYWRRRQG